MLIIVTYKVYLNIPTDVLHTLIKKQTQVSRLYSAELAWQTIL